MAVRFALKGTKIIRNLVYILRTHSSLQEIAIQHLHITRNMLGGLRVIESNILLGTQELRIHIGLYEVGLVVHPILVPLVRSATPCFLITNGSFLELINLLGETLVARANLPDLFCDFVGFVHNYLIF